MATPTLSAQNLKTLLQDGGEIALLDVREEGQFGEGHLLFATPLPYSRLEAGISMLVPRKSARVVLCDDGDGIATRAAARLTALGYGQVAVLNGGNPAWVKAGYALFKGVNVPSKLFGELVEHVYNTPHITIAELAQMKKDGEDFVIVDGRPYAEYHKMSIPGGICCPNAELPLRIRDIVKDTKTRIVVNCAGRTRSIMGAQTLLNFGIENPVYALENGTQGWALADFELEREATRKYPERYDAARLPAMQATARALMSRHGVAEVSRTQAEAWARESGRSLYLLDVRTAEEYAAGSLVGAQHAPGGQLVQATDQWVGVRNARILLVDDEGVRAPVVAAWLRQLGCDAYVMEDGVRSGFGLHGAANVQPVQTALPALPTVSAADLKRTLDAQACVALDLRDSAAYRAQHIPGSRWSIRPRVAADAHGIRAVVLIASDETIARAAAVDLFDAGVGSVALLDGGLAAWREAGYPLEASADSPPDSERIDFLFFVHDRHSGNRAAMKQYLKWETGLIAQLDTQDRQLFRVGVMA